MARPVTRVAARSGQPDLFTDAWWNMAYTGDGGLPEIQPCRYAEFYNLGVPFRWLAIMPWADHESQVHDRIVCGRIGLLGILLFRHLDCIRPRGMSGCKQGNNPLYGSTFWRCLLNLPVRSKSFTFKIDETVLDRGNANDHTYEPRSIQLLQCSSVLHRDYMSFQI